MIIFIISYKSIRKCHKSQFKNFSHFISTACKWGTFFKSTPFSEKVRLIKEYNVKPLSVRSLPVSGNFPSFISALKWCRLIGSNNHGFDFATMDRIRIVPFKSVFDVPSVFVFSNHNNQPIDMSVLKTPSDKMYVRGFKNSFK